LLLVAVLYGLMVVVLPVQMLTMMMAPLLILVGLILWMLPDVGGMSIGRIQSLLVAFVGLSVAWPNYLALNLPGLPWITPTRVALFWLVAVFAINFSTSRELRDELRNTVSAMPRFTKIFWLFWLATTFSLIFSDQFAVSIGRYASNQIYWTMLFFAAALAATRPGFVVQLSKALLWGTIIVLIYSLYEAAAQRVLWIDYLPPFLKIDPEVMELVTDTQARAGTDVYRVRGPFTVALYFSEFLTMVFPFFVHATAQERRLKPFLALLAATIGLMVLMRLTDARSAMIGIVVVLAAYPLYIAARQLAKKNRSIMGPAIVYGYPAVAAVLALVIIFWRRAHVLVLGGGQHQGSSDARAEQWAMALPKLASHPFGHGMGRGNAAVGYLTPDGRASVDSYYLTLMMDAGYLALPLFLLMFLIPAVVAFWYFRTAKTPEMKLLAPLSLALLNFTIVRSVLSPEHNMPFAFIFVGCIVGLAWQRQRETDVAAAAALAEAAQRPLPSKQRRTVPALSGSIGRA
jgi:hypothetical protein